MNRMNSSKTLLRGQIAFCEGYRVPPTASTHEIKTPNNPISADVCRNAREAFSEFKKGLVATLSDMYTNTKGKLSDIVKGMNTSNEVAAEID